MSLIHWWPLNGDTKDYGTTNSNLNVLYGNPSFTSGKIGQCANLSNGQAYYIGTSMACNSVTGYSVAAWVKFSSLDSGHRSGIWSNRSSGPVWSSCEIQNNKLCYHHYNNAWLSTFGNTTLTTGRWYHVCFVIKNRAVMFYIDGANDGTGDATLSGDNQNLCDSVGCSWSSDSALNGCLNDVRIYDHALSAKEVKEISKCLVLHYNFEDPYAEGTTNLYAYTGSNPLWSSTAYNGQNGQYGYNDDSNLDYSYVDASDKNGKMKRMVKVNIRNNVDTRPYVFFDGLVPDGDGQYKTISFDIFTNCSNFWLSPYSYYDGYFVSYWDEETKQWIGGTSSSIDIPMRPNQWNHVVYRFLRSGADYGNGPGYCPIGLTSSTSDYWLFDNVQIEAKDHATPYVNGTRQPGLIYDNSGYGYNGTQIGNLQIVNTSASGEHSALFSSDNTWISTNYKTAGLDVLTYSAWVFPTARTSDRSCISIGGTYFTIDENGYLSGYAYGKNPEGYFGGNTVIPLNQWTHTAIVWDESYMYGYINGQLDFKVATTGTFSVPNGQSIGQESGAYRQFYGQIADLKIYATALSASDILAEYNRKASIDKDGKLFAPYIKEHETTNNLLSYVNYRIESQDSIRLYLSVVTKDNYEAHKNDSDYAYNYSLGAYTQANLNVTMTSQGIRIYSEPNDPYSNYNQWGGICISPMAISDCLFKGHRYRLSWHASGQSSRAMNEVYFSSQVGWGTGATNPSTTSNKLVTTPSNFNGEMDCFWDFTINDDIFKVCTDNGGNTSFTVGETYLSYAGLKMGFGYEDTGTLGTDLYITNIQLHDLTNGDVYKVEKNGIVKTTEAVSGRRDSARLHSDGVIDVADIVEC